MKQHFGIIVLALILMASVGIVSAAGQPSCDFTATPVTGQEDLTVTFTGTAYNMSPLFSYHWDFGDATGAEVTSVSSVSPITHTYQNPGKYTVSLAVYDVGFPVTNWYESEKIDYIAVTNTPPVVSISPATQTVHLGEKAEFTSTVSGNDLISYIWTFGDGHVIPPVGNEIIPTTGITYEHTGTYSVTLAVTNDGGTTTSAPVEVIVIPPVPVADFVGNPQLGMAPLAVKFWDGTNPIMNVTSWLWEFGDGQTSTEKDPLHAYASPNLYDVTLTVNNGYDSGSITKANYINVTSTDPFPDPVCENTTVYVNQTEYVYINSSTPTINNVGIFRKATGIWYLDTDGDRLYNLAERFGGATDIPVPGDYNGDTFSDIAIFRPSTGFWYIDTNRDGVIDIQRRFGGAADIVMPGDYNADGKTDIAIFRPATGYWYIDTNLDGTIDISFRYGGSNDVPLIGNWAISTPE